MSEADSDRREQEAGTLTRAFRDGDIRFLPPFTKDQAVYLEPGDRGFDAAHERCGECVHFIDGGGCHFVQGAIGPAAYCEEFFADYGVFAHEHADGVEINAELFGPTWSYDEPDIFDFVDEIERRMQERRREQEQTAPEAD